MPKGILGVNEEKETMIYTVHLWVTMEILVSSINVSFLNSLFFRSYKSNNRATPRLFKPLSCHVGAQS